MKQKTILILSVALIIIAIYFAFFKDRNSVFNKYDYAIKDTSQINSITIENISNKIILKKYNNKWKINKTFSANQIAITNFLRVLSNLDFVSKIENKLKDSISTSLDELGVKITIKENSKIISELIIGSVNKYKTGTYVKKSGSEVVVVNATGITNDISKVISVNSLFWRNKTIFNFNVNEIKNIEFYNIKNKNKSFNIEKTNDTFILKNFENKKIKASINNIKRYLSYFKKIGFTKLENNINKTKKDTILITNLAYKITVIDNKDVKYRLNLYLKPNTQKNEYQFDMNNIYGVFNKDTNLLIIAYYTIDPILKEIDYFKNDL